MSILLAAFTIKPMFAPSSDGVRKIDGGRLLGVLAFALALVVMTYLVFGPTISFTKSSAVVKNDAGVAATGKAVSGATSSYATGDRAMLVVAGGVMVAAFLGAVFAWRRRRLAVIMVGLAFIAFSVAAIFSVGIFIFPVGIVFLAAGALCRTVRGEAQAP